MFYMNFEGCGNDFDDYTYMSFNVTRSRVINVASGVDKCSVLRAMIVTV